jgi:hypothetical protein
LAGNYFVRTHSHGGRYRRRAIIRVRYQNGGAMRIDEIGVKLKRVVATGMAVKVSCAA